MATLKEIEFPNFRGFAYQNLRKALEDMQQFTQNFKWDIFTCPLQIQTPQRHEKPLNYLFETNL